MRLAPLVIPLAALLLLGAATMVERVPAEREASDRAKPTLLPDLRGRTLDDQELSLGSLLGKRLILVMFRPDTAEADLALRAAAALAPLRSRNNFEIVGVAAGWPVERTRAYAQERGLSFPILNDPGNSLKLRKPAAVLVTDAQRYVLSSMAQLGSHGYDTPALVEARIRETLRLPPEGASESTPLVERPQAPDFVAARLGGGELTLASLRGKRVALIFFLHDCPHCHGALELLRSRIAELPEASRPQVYGVEISGRDSRISDSLKQKKLDFFDVLVDHDWKLRNAFGVFGDVPVIFLIDAEGRIVYRSKAGWDAGRDPAIVGSWLARLAGTSVPMLLPEQGYSGNDLCVACHEAEHATWQLTRHASAFESLVKIGAEHKPECVKCHVVGFAQPGGFAPAGHVPNPSDFEDVGCESCHGRGGPHRSPEFAKEGSYEPVCITCHDAQHSLGFDYAAFRPKISHSALAALSREERDALLAAQARPREVLPSGAAFVGSEACKSCHAAEYQTWSSSAHARAIETLAKGDHSGSPDCQRCHTTGFERAGGFEPGTRPGAQADLARVGCESCHGPGADHVGGEAKRVGTIVSLGDKCKSCAILKVCGACHDEANDPGFGFEVEARIDKQRHGTIEPAATRAAPSPAAGP